MNIRCSGCGAKIQFKDPTLPGYIEKAVFDKHKEDYFYCKRCFDLKHYNKNTIFDYEKTEYYKNLEEIKKDKGLIVYIVDAFDLDGSLISNINDLFKSENILLVANKIDLYLNSINVNNLNMYLRRYLKEKNVKFKDLILMSSFRNDDIDRLIDKIKDLKEPKQNVYFLGMTNVGKSSIINKIIYKYTNEEDLITVSNNVNTTLSNIYIPFDENSCFVDTPGILNKESLIYYLDKESYKAITPKSFIKPKTFQLNPGQSLFVAGFTRIDFVSGERSSFITNFNNSLLIHRSKLENAEDFYNLHKDDILIYPNKDEREKLGNLKTREIKFTKEKKIDIAIYGIGFISVYGEGTLKITSFEQVRWAIREAII